MSFASLGEAQTLAVALLRFAVNDGNGRDESDAVYKAVTENRDGPTPAQRARYSSCGDLAHWLLRCMGVRAGWLNRDDDGDAQRWKSGVNLNWLCPPPIGKCHLAHSKLAGMPMPGDVFVENNAYGGHVFCAIAYDPHTDTLTTAEYGQPGGKLKRRSAFCATFDRHAYAHIRLEEVIASPWLVADPVAAPNWAFPAPSPAARPVLRLGAQGDAVKELQRRLGLAADGKFGPATRGAVVTFQVSAGLKADGVVGSVTWHALGFR